MQTPHHGLTAVTFEHYPSGYFFIHSRVYTRGFLVMRGKDLLLFAPNVFTLYVFDF